jgi:hypothetical protein
MDDPNTPERTRPPVRTREQLIHLLTVAAELEHGLSCSYLFAAWSLATDPSEGGLSPEQRALVADWKQTLIGVAIDEMGHLGQVANLLTAIGGLPHLVRPNFPQPADAYPFAIPLTLEPFSRDTLERFVRFELPEEEGAALPTISDGPHDGIEPFVPPFATIGELYARIRATFEAIPEEVLFVGPTHAQAIGEEVALGNQLVRICDRASALQAIERVVSQGEGASSEEDGHYQRFREILARFDAETADGGFSPVRPVVANPVIRQRGDAETGRVVTHPRTHRVAELADYAYETLLLLLMRWFAHVDDDEDDLRALSATAIGLMGRVISPLGEALTRMPFADDGSGRTAGAGFGRSRSLALPPHRRAAFIVLHERLARIADHAERLAPEGPPELGRAAVGARALADGFRPEQARL